MDFWRRCNYSFVDIEQSALREIEVVSGSVADYATC